MTLNEYIIQNAGRGSDSGFLRQFGSAEVFFSIENPDEHLADGPLVTSTDVKLHMQAARLEFGNMALFYTTKDDARLAKRFGGMPLIKAAELVCGLAGVDGMLIQSNSDAWFAADKQSIKQVIGQVRKSEF